MNYLDKLKSLRGSGSEGDVRTSQAELPSGVLVLGGMGIQSKSLDELEIKYMALISVCGFITDAEDIGSDEKTAQETFESIAAKCREDVASKGVSIPFEKVWYGGSKFIIPGFVDTHCHAPQYAFTGTGMDLPLLKWLEKYTFPCESKFKDIEHARKVYEKSVKAHLYNGSTFCSYFATIHSPAARVLAEVCDEMGQRAFVGKVSMDRNSPDYYVEETDKGCEDMEAFARDIFSRTRAGQDYLDKIDSMAGTEEVCGGDLKDFGTSLPRVLPAVTPRFVPTCSEEMMRRLGTIASKYGLPIQSHLSENMDECEWVAALHPKIKGYGAVYNDMGLLNERTYMAHCVYSDENERRLMKDTGCGVCHCPSSNFSLGSGVMDIRVFLNEGVKVGLGTDVAGGYSPSMLDAIRQAITASMASAFRRRELIKSNGEDKLQSLAPLNYKEAFYLATLGGACAIGMGHVLGSLSPGKATDCLVIDIDSPGSPIDTFGTEDIIEKFQKFLYLGDDRNITHVYVAQQLVKGH